MFLNRPHLRFDGIYVSRNTYIRTGIVEWRVKNPVHLVCYYRYLRFFPHGEFAYRTTPQTVAAVASTLEKLPRERARGGSSTSAGGAEPVLQGRYRMLVRACVKSLTNLQEHPGRHISAAAHHKRTKTGCTLCRCC